MTERPTALITGAAGGIGSALAAGFRTAGYEVTAADRSGGEQVFALDVSDSDAVAALGARLSRLSVLINAAGINRRREEYGIDTFADVVEVNLTATMRMALACKPALAAAGGSIINVASMFAFFGAPHAPGYAASKGGVAQLTRSLAVAWATDGIRVNAIAPGWIETAMTAPVVADAARSDAVLARTPMKRWGQPEDLVGPALFLASEAARFVTGVILPVDGGYAAM
jgi:NAD(P)-dependent dehydrogenase (short-subunit alcohol dehydrogenase family)